MHIFKGGFIWPILYNGCMYEFRRVKVNVSVGFCVCGMIALMQLTGNKTHIYKKPFLFTYFFLFFIFVYIRIVHIHVKLTFNYLGFLKIYTKTKQKKTLYMNKI